MVGDKGALTSILQPPTLGDRFAGIIPSALSATNTRRQTGFMSELWSLAAPGGAVATTLIGVLVGSMVSRRAQDHHWVREQQAAACARLLQESTTVLVDLSTMEASRLEGIP